MLLLVKAKNLRAVQKTPVLFTSSAPPTQMLELKTFVNFWGKEKKNPQIF